MIKKFLRLYDRDIENNQLLDILNKTTRKIREKALIGIFRMGHSHFYVCIENCCIDAFSIW